ncbi:MAG: hypothetical protein KDD44_06390 [Bdellovibrionales bacterium]|nr:hypothetical protein [Bdellovibrionales bacterium]
MHSSGIFKVIASFVDSNGQPLSGSSFQVRLFDEDRFFDDKLGAAKLDAEGRAEFLIFVSDIMSIDSPGERTPDLYFVLEQDGEEIFRSEVFSAVDFERKSGVTGQAQELTKAFGPFRVTR